MSLCRPCTSGVYLRIVIKILSKVYRKSIQSRTGFYQTSIEDLSTFRTRKVIKDWNLGQPPPTCDKGANGPSFSRTAEDLQFYERLRNLWIVDMIVIFVAMDTGAAGDTGWRLCASACLLQSVIDEFVCNLPDFEIYEIRESLKVLSSRGQQNLWTHKKVHRCKSFQKIEIKSEHLAGTPWPVWFNASLDGSSGSKGHKGNSKMRAWARTSRFGRAPAGWTKRSLFVSLLSL